ncbi:PREDICTED: uncharacterized protein LOC107072299 isoform X2 [Polistes dominula]|uniref:Uncharacterized protein LOC107072299 isoform X2 n=1 Tax=Polistes dominula TaxID=743375 RepID=A0ABM1J555_POLDO|nr:PREDICTED: uncharacterized protein LOC107072299 isoform X2 [Polistes dominula]
METFLNINWGTSFTDIVDNEFINGKRLLKESVTHRLLNGDFKNPFSHMDEDYEAVKIDMTEISDDSSEENETPFSFEFPMSALTAEEQYICLRTIMKFNRNELPIITPEDKQDLCTFNKKKNIIKKEQDLYLKIVEKIWKTNKWTKIYCENFFNAKWKDKFNNVHALPTYYLKVTNIPRILDEEINVKFVSTCLTKGKLPEIKLPSLTKPFKLDCNCKRLQKYFPILNISCNPSMHFKLPVSEDPSCISLAQDNEVDLVISSSGLKYLANDDSGRTQLRRWLLPVTIKHSNGKNIIYVNKPTPPIQATVPEKNRYVFKYILRKTLFEYEPVSEKSNNTKIYDDDMFGNLHSDDYLQLEGDQSSLHSRSTNSLTNSSTNSSINSLTNSSTNSSSNTELMEDLENKSVNVDVSELKESDYLNASKLKEEMHNIEKEIQKVKYDIKASYVSYNLFTIGPLSNQKKIKEYKILVRTKEHGYETLEHNSEKLTRQKLLLVPKLEHQTAFGGEAITLNEGLKQWISLIFRPNTSIARVRISVSKAEIIQIQKCNAKTISNEVQRLYNKNVNVSLILLYNMIKSLSCASPGNYIITNSHEKTSFCIYKETSTMMGEDLLDLSSLYKFSHCRTIPTFSWPKLDKLCITPLHKRLNRMPLMFIPRKGHKRKFEGKSSTSK